MMTKDSTVHKANELQFQSARTPLPWFRLWGARWSNLRHLLLAFAAASLLVACGGGGGGGGGGSGTVAVPAPPKQLEILSAVVNEGDREVDASQPVDPRVTVRFVFSGNLAASGVGVDKVQLSDGTRTYPVNIVIADSTLTVAAIGNLHTSLNYTLTVKAGATSGDGSVLKSDYAIKFRTVPAVFEAKLLMQGDRLTSGVADTRTLIEDINGDGRPDLVKLGKHNVNGSPNNAYTLSIFLQNATGGFDSFQKLEYILNRSGYSAYFKSLVVQDIDGDKKPELLVAESPSDMDRTAVAGIRIFKADAAGKYVASDFIETLYVQKLQAMDVDGDGLIDLVGYRGETSYERTSAFQILRKTSNGFTQLAPVELPGGDYEFGVADLDLDGKRELIVNRTNYSDGPVKSELLIYSQSAPATFSTNTALTNEAVGFCSFLDTCTKMKVVDMNGDGRPELVFGGRKTLDGVTTNVLLTFSRPPSGGLTKVSQVTLDYGNFYGDVYAVQDMDGDGVPDALAVAAGYYGLLKGGSDFSWVFSNRIKTPVDDTLYPTDVAIGDIDGDGLPDVVFDSLNPGIVMARQVNFRRRP